MEVATNAVAAGTSSAEPQESSPFIAPTTGIKRTRSTTSSSASTLDTKVNSKNVKMCAKPPIKKQCTKEEIDLLMKPTEKFFDENSEKYPLSFADFKTFLKDCYGQSNLIPIARGYSTDIENLIKQLRDTYPHVDSRKMKSRITKVKNSLEKPGDQQVIESSTDDE
ncbi:hypothetical protein QAD02_010924 [Eretmocerus hayati]|uniref:Uncharacterized protein n=2 Tax=Eretmocerus hayati TaxID=131215 RepID=A0ACC2NWA4_9HYME|nr:hypothetical protein QAD02_006978 [Eretmocerus hayati]KAJ8675138.1 hypothetical protein QAD02_010924 [Eretmocerus hayati]